MMNLLLRFFCLPIFLCLGFLCLGQAANAALNVFACEPEWGALAAELGGKNVNITIATTAQQDPHQIQARPSLIAKVRNANLVVCTGAELEVGWLPVLLQRGANPRVQPGQLGFLRQRISCNYWVCQND